MKSSCAFGAVWPVQRLCSGYLPSVNKVLSLFLSPLAYVCSGTLHICGSMAGVPIPPNRADQLISKMSAGLDMLVSHRPLLCTHGTVILGCRLLFVTIEYSTPALGNVSLG